MAFTKIHGRNLFSFLNLFGIRKPFYKTTDLVIVYIIYYILIYFRGFLVY